MKRLAFVLSIITLFAIPSSALADIAPPQNPPGSSLDPGSEITQVRMVAETVLIELRKDSNPTSVGNAHVTADFTMRNLGTAVENLAVRFPLAVNNGYDNSYPEITEVVIKVGEKQVAFRRANYLSWFDPSYTDDIVPWAVFDVSFPVRQDVAIQVAYNLSGTAHSYQNYTSFDYVLVTGAGWKDTIGSADIILRLPYPANMQNVLIEEGSGWTTLGGTFEDNEVRWHLEDFEPDPNGPVRDMEFSVIKPALWQSVLTERENVAKNPNDGEAWGRLAKAYKEVFFLPKGYRTDLGGEELYPLTIEAYEKCLSLEPDDAQWHAGFADLLAYHSEFSRDSAEIQRALEEIHIALLLAPNDPKVLEIAEEIRYMFPEEMLLHGNQYDFPSLTSTPHLLDPAAVSGTYQSETLTILSTGQRVQLTLTLHSEGSAELESKFDNNKTNISTGFWRDNKNGTLSIFIPNDPHDRMTFIVKNDLLQDYTFPSFFHANYYSTRVDFKRVVNATPTRQPTATPVILLTDTPRPQPTSSPTDSAPAPKSPSSVCGSAMLIPLIAMIWFGWKRRQQRN